VLSNEPKTKAYVAPKPPPQWAQKAKWPFAVKMHFACRKSATKFLCVNTVSDKVVSHSLAHLSEQNWFAWNVPVYYVKSWLKLTYSLQKDP